MKKWIISLFSATLISGCSTVPSSSKPHPEKYTFQVIGIEIPGDMPEYHNKDDQMMGLEFSKGSSIPTSLTIPSIPASLTIPNRDVEKLIQHPKAKITEYPTVLAGIGESVTNDQRMAVSFPEDYDIVDGKAVAREKVINLGYIVGITVEKIEDGAVSYHLNASYKELVDFDEHTTENGLKIKMPFFTASAVDTDLTQQPNSWLTIGALVDERSNGEKKSLMTCVKITPPSTEK